MKAAGRRVGDAEAKRLQRSIQSFVRSFGLLVTKQTPCGSPVSPSYAHALMYLLEREQEGKITTQSELARELGLDKSSIARLCALLARNRHATQERAPDDGRSRRLELTPAGRRMSVSIHAASLERFRHVTSAVPAPKRAALFESLAALTAAVQSLEEVRR